MPITDAEPTWSGWIPLRGAGRNQQLPVAPGLYRVRRHGGEPPLYIGQTSRSLRERLGMLGGVYAAEMPYSDPHTAGPALWALRHLEGVDYECSVAVIAGSRRQILAAEAVAITLHRAAFGGSPAFNFGRMPHGYRKSSGNNSRLAAAGRRFRGGPDPTVPDDQASVLVAGPLRSAPAASDWMGLSWSDWTPFGDTVGAGAIPPGSRGVYRLRDSGSDELLYVGQGVIASRFAAHARSASTPGSTKNRLFGGEVEASWVQLDHLSVRCLLEVENDLIASHVLVFGRAPASQFAG
ncbi:MAG: hypothetical protein ACOYOQ_14445 [Microthrixaceae bacterium]